MRNIQYELEDENFLRLKEFCIVQRKSLKSVSREAVLLYLINNSLNEGDLEHGKKIRQEN
jgi:hypothetical protein